MYDPTDTRTCQEILNTALPTITKLTAAQISDASNIDLQRTLKTYEQYASDLLTYYNTTFSAFSTTKVAYEQVYEKVDEIEAALENIIGPAPFAVLNDFSEDELLREAAGWSAIAGAGFSLMTFTYKLYKLNTARKAYALAKSTANLGRQISYAATAQVNLIRLADMSNDMRKMRQAAAASGALSLVMSTAGIILKVQQDKIENEALSGRVTAFGDWFADVETRVVQLCDACRYLRGELEDLKTALGVPPGPLTDAALVASLSGQVFAAGEVEASLTTVYRGMCKADITVDDAIAFSGLPDTGPIRTRLTARRSQLLANSKEICMIEYPDLFE